MIICIFLTLSRLLTTQGLRRPKIIPDIIFRPMNILKLHLPTCNATPINKDIVSLTGRDKRTDSPQKQNKGDPRKGSKRNVINCTTASGVYYFRDFLKLFLYNSINIFVYFPRSHKQLFVISTINALCQLFKSNFIEL